VILLTDFPKAATKQAQMGKSDSIDVLYCIYSAVKQMRNSRSGLLTRKCFSEMTIYICLQSVKHLYGGPCVPP